MLQLCQIDCGAFVKSGNCVWRYRFTCQRFFRPPPPLRLAGLKCHPPLCAARWDVLQLCPESATLAVSTKPARRGAVRGSLLFLLFATLLPISVYISGLIIRPDMSLVGIAPGNAGAWHPRLAISQGRCRQGERKQVCLCIGLLSPKKKRRKTCVGFVLIPVELSTCLGLEFRCLMHFQGPYLFLSVYSYVPCNSGLVIGFLCTEFTPLALSPSVFLPSSLSFCLSLSLWMSHCRIIRPRALQGWLSSDSIDGLEPPSPPHQTTQKAKNYIKEWQEERKLIKKEQMSWFCLCTQAFLPPPLTWCMAAACLCIIKPVHLWTCTCDSAFLACCFLEGHWVQWVGTSGFFPG